MVQHGLRPHVSSCHTAEVEKTTLGRSLLPCLGSTRSCRQPSRSRPPLPPTSIFSEAAEPLVSLFLSDSMSFAGQPVVFPRSAVAAVSSCCGVEIASFKRLEKGSWAPSGAGVRLLGMERCGGYPRASPSITVCTVCVCAYAETSEHFGIF